MARMGTKTAAMKKARNNELGGYAYQFEAGHWSWCSFQSPNGEALRESGGTHIRLPDQDSPYNDLRTRGIPVQKCERVMGQCDS